MTQSASPKRLYRSRNERVLGGVCGGIADYFKTDPTLVRLLFILICLAGFGLTVFWYFIAWVIIPLAPDVTAQSTESNQS